MPRHLLIMRHAKSSWDSEAPSDFDRPLAKRGKKDVPRMGSWLREQGLTPDYVLSSPAQRARQTAVKVCHELGIQEDQINWEPGIYEASLPALLEILKDCPPAAQRVLLVGHNPGLELLVAYLCGKATPLPADGKLLPTAAVAVLTMPADWRPLRPGCAQLAAITSPRMLAEPAP